ncbi:MAG: hypothetical protein JST00_12300 [Deltaproteobacteria bacterium]|nr:hypothetical protein [Deltaproteobacteria bacterium]
MTRALVSALAASLSLVALPAVAHASEGSPRGGSDGTELWSSGGREERDAADVSVYRRDGLLGPFRFGPTIGAGAPEGLRFGVFVRVAGILSVGGAFSWLPTLQVPGIDDATIVRASGEGFLRLHPFRGAFFLGVAGGYVQTKGSLMRSQEAFGQVQTVETHAYANAAYVAPHLGFQWQLPFGMTIGCDAGVELPIEPKAPTFDASKYGLTFPIEGKGAVADAMTYLTSKPIPVVHLLEVGFAL